MKKRSGGQRGRAASPVQMLSVVGGHVRAARERGRLIVQDGSPSASSPFRF
jgi:hypothetical protein